jgi:hypothetical protein
MSTYTFTGTETYTTTDVKVVMQNTYEDIIGFANREIITFEKAKNWIDDLTYILDKKAMDFFEIQLRDKNNVWYKTYKYDVDTNGYLGTGAASGGISYYSLPEGTKATLLVSLDESKPNAKDVREELNKRGWGTGTASVGNSTAERNYINNSLQLSRSVITK